MGSEMCIRDRHALYLVVEARCSGVLILPKVVLTADHCLWERRLPLPQYWQHGPRRDGRWRLYNAAGVQTTNDVLVSIALQQKHKQAIAFGAADCLTCSNNPLQQYRMQPEDISVKVAGTSWETMEPFYGSVHFPLFISLANACSRRQRFLPQDYGLSYFYGEVQPDQEYYHRLHRWVSNRSILCFQPFQHKELWLGVWSVPYLGRIWGPGDSSPGPLFRPSGS